MKKIVMIGAIMFMASVSVASAGDLILAALSYREGMRENASAEKWLANVEFFKNSIVSEETSVVGGYSQKPVFKNFYDAKIGEEVSRFAFAGILSGSVIHPFGHMMEGAKYGVPVKVDYKAMGEYWNTPDSRAEETDINGAGFQTQDQLALAANAPEIYL